MVLLSLLLLRLPGHGSHYLGMSPRRDFGQLLMSGFPHLQFSKFNLVYSADVSSLSFVSILVASGVVFRKICVAAISISSLAATPKNSKIRGPSVISRCPPVDHCFSRVES